MISISRQSRRPRSLRLGAPVSAVAALGFLLGACTVVDGDKAALTQMSTPAAAVPATEAPAEALAYKLPAERPAMAAPQSSLPAPAQADAKVIQAAYTVGSAAELKESGRLTDVARAALVYARFEAALNEAAKSKLNTPREVRRILKDLRFQDSNQIAQGWLASRALIAARDPVFAKAVRDEAAKGGADSLMRQLQSNGSLVQTLSGAANASQAVISATANDNQKMADVSERFLAAARTFQNNKWGKLTPLPGSDLERDYAMVEQLEDEGLSLADFSPIQPALAYNAPVMERILSLGALHVIQTSGEESAAGSSLLGGHNDGARCLRWSRLNLNQCLAASHFPSEEAWCTAKHGVEEVRACWSKMLPSYQSSSN